MKDHLLNSKKLTIIIKIISILSDSIAKETILQVFPQTKRSVYLMHQMESLLRKLKIKKHEGGIFSCEWNQEGNHFVTASADKTLKLWDADTAKCLKTFKAKKLNPQVDDMQTCVGIVKNSLVSVSLSGLINIWNDYENAKDEEEPNLSYIGHQTGITQLAFIKSKNLLVSGDQNGRLIIWEEKKGKLVTGEGHTSQVMKIQVSKDDEFIYTLSFDATIKKIDIASAKFIKSFETTEKAIDIIVSKKDKNTIYVLYENGKIKKYEDLEEKSEIKFKFTPCVFDISSTDIFVVGDMEGTVYFLNEKGDIIDKLQQYEKKVTAIKISNGDKFLAVGDNHHIRLWDFATKKNLNDNMVYHTSTVSSFDFNENNTYLLSTSWDTKVIVWNLSDYSRQAEIKAAHRKEIHCGLFNNSGQFITGSADYLIKRWNLL